MHRIAIIDLGTNTFHLFIVELDGGKSRTLYKEKIAVKIGKNGISRGRIAPEAMKRAIHTLKVFRNVIDQFEVKDIRGVATSAIRNATNGRELLEKVRQNTGIEIEVITGDREAELIYYGVKAAIELDSHPQLIMDIGGGSVEFIIGNTSEIFWKSSFEIGAQRLLDKFHQNDPIEQSSIGEMFEFLGLELSTLIKAIEQFKPVGFIGCSGTFDTLKDIHSHKRDLNLDATNKSFDLPIQAYREIHKELVTKNREERLHIPGMVTMRVDMIVVASCLISFVLQHMSVSSVTVCTYALKEGVLFLDQQNTPINNI